MSEFAKNSKKDNEKHQQHHQQQNQHQQQQQCRWQQAILTSRRSSGSNNNNEINTSSSSNKNLCNNKNLTSKYVHNTKLLIFSVLLSFDLYTNMHVFYVCCAGILIDKACKQRPCGAFDEYLCLNIRLVTDNAITIFSIGVVWARLKSPAQN